MLVASSGLGLYLLNNDSVQVNKDFHGNPLAPIQILNTWVGCLVVYSWFMTLMQVMSVSLLSISPRGCPRPQQRQQVADQHQMANPQYPPTEKSFSFCKIGKNGATNILAVSADGSGNGGYIAQKTSVTVITASRGASNTQVATVSFMFLMTATAALSTTNRITPVKLTERFKF